MLDLRQRKTGYCRAKFKRCYINNLMHSFNVNTFEKRCCLTASVFQNFVVRMDSCRALVSTVSWTENERRNYGGFSTASNPGG